MTDVEAPRPKYAQIAEMLRSRIKRGDYPPGSNLPSEDHLARELGVSRVTVNRAVSVLRAAGDVTVKRGSGTVVRSLPKIVRDAEARYAARDEGTGAGEVEARKLNLRPRTDYLEIGQTAAPAEVAQALDIAEGQPVLVRRRVLYANDEPTQMADSYYPWELVKDSAELLQPEAGVGGSLTRLAELGYPPVRFAEDIDVRLPTPEEHQVLQIEATQPVFRIWRVTYSHDRRPIEICDHVMPGHLWTLHYGWRDEASNTRRDQ
ncbi:GntR family transcriptional regulator [Natronosporangium hydrolyticum]|uniref:GntR family transcriptional regulator n=1 Tax=Natronosporangium hydrolyticum TaxID=2811111 RepID=A0A895YBJ3_9ACTN|nr:GntR family transcriptional regulator [Natronosporangium hydrolyticum]QSB15174.1 GntR family transcriptional regulator [Natronosporangium hydrolyticum]